MSCQKGKNKTTQVEVQCSAEYPAEGETRASLNQDAWKCYHPIVFLKPD